jgi:hypothetical protein
LVTTAWEDWVMVLVTKEVTSTGVVTVWYTVVVVEACGLSVTVTMTGPTASGSNCWQMCFTLEIPSSTSTTDCTFEHTSQSGRQTSES